jgi:hypothetical protein
VSLGDLKEPHSTGRKADSYDSWLDRFKAMQPGDVRVYHTVGITPRCNAAFAAAWDAQERGFVTLHQRRRGDNRLEYVAFARPEKYRTKER